MVQDHWFCALPLQAPPASLEPEELVLAALVHLCLTVCIPRNSSDSMKKLRSVSINRWASPYRSHIVDYYSSSHDPLRRLQDDSQENSPMPSAFEFVVCHALKLHHCTKQRRLCFPAIATPAFVRCESIVWCSSVTQVQEPSSMFDEPRETWGPQVHNLAGCDSQQRTASPFPWLSATGLISKMISLDRAFFTAWANTFNDFSWSLFRNTFQYPRSSKSFGTAVVAHVQLPFSGTGHAHLHFPASTGHLSVTYSFAVLWSRTKNP